MQPGRQYNQHQTFGLYFPQSTAQQQQFQPALGPPTFQPYGSAGPQFYGGQPLLSVAQRYPPPQLVPQQNYGGQPFIGAPPVKPFPDQPFNQQLPPPPQGAPQPQPLTQVPPPPQTPPQSQGLYLSPVNQGPSNQYAWSTTVTPPSPYYNTDRVSPVQPCQVPLPPRLKMLGQYVAQVQNAFIEVNNNENSSNFSPDLTTFGTPPPAFSDNKILFKQKASELGINIESPPKLEDLDTDITNNNKIYNNEDSFQDYSDIKENFKFGKTDVATTSGIQNLKSGKRPRDEGTEARSPIRLPAKTVAQRNLNKQKIRDDWWSLSDTSNLSDNRHNSTNVQGNGYLNNSNRLLESSRYSSFPDSSVDVSKVLAESSVNSGVDSKHDEVFDDSVDYIEEHEFLSYDVTSSPFSAYDTDEEHEENGCLETRGHDEMPESPIPDVTYSIVNVKQELNSEIDAVKSNNEKVFLKFQKELEESEIRKIEVLKSRVVSDENIEVLASAIVTGVLAKAVIEIISFDSGDKIVKDSMKIIDIESSVDGNFNTNAKNDSSKTNAEIRELQEFHEKKEKGNENEQNISENNENISPTNDRPRLYSWPYSENNSESKNETDKPNGKVIEVITPSKAHKVEIIVDQNASSEKEKLSVDLISKTVKTASESSKDFEKFYFKQKASQHGIEIASPLRNLKETATVSSESDNESERSHQNNENIMAQMKKGQLDSLGRNSRSQSESSDYQSLESDSQTDPAYIFKQKASKLGIKIQNPKETIELSTENSDAELESYTFKNQDLHLEDSSRRDTSTPEPNLFLNPESPEFKPGWRKGMENNIRTSTRNEMRADAPEFNPGSLKTGSSDLNDSTSKIEMRVDAPEFNPVNFSMKTASQKLESLKKADENHTKSAKIFHIPTPKAQIEKPSIGIQASPKLSDCSVNTRRVKTKDLGVETNSCDSREVCVNTDVPGNMETESHTLSIKEKHFLSKNTNTDVPKRRSIAVSVNMTGRYQEKKIESENKEFVAEMCKLENEKAVMAEQIKYLQSCKNDKEQAEQMKSLQVEVMKHRANLHMNRIFLMQYKIQKETAALIDSLAFSNDRQARDTIHGIADAKFNMLEATSRRINAFLEETLEKIQSGVQYQTLPDFTFFSDDPEQNRIVANEQLYDLAIGTPLRGNLQSPVKIYFSPTNKNLIEFTAKPNLEDVRTPERPKRTPVLAGKPKQSPAANPVKVAAAISPGFANKPSCLFVNKVDTAERNGFIEDEDEEIVSRKLLGDDPEDIIDADQIRGKEKFRGGLMDLDLDSDEEITEVSTALKDYDDLSLNEGIDFGKMDDKYGPGNGDLKELISYKMNEVYRDISEYNTCESSANESNLAEKTAIEKSGETSGNKELLDSVEAGKDVSHVERGETDVGNTENENEEVGTADKGESGKRSDISKLKSEFGVNEQSEKIIEPVEGKKSENADKENKVKANEVPENWESLELDKDEVYMSPEVQFNLPDKSDNKDSSVPDNPFNEELSSSVGAGKSSVSVDKTETDVAVTKTDSEVKSSVQSVQNVNESRVKLEMKTSVSVTASYPTSLTTTVSSASSALLASSVNNSLSSAMSMLQSAGANVMAPPMLMTNMNPMLYQMVVGQLIKAYPALTANPDMLSNVALQQTSLLQHYIATGQISAANINEAFLQGAGDGAGKLGNLEQTGSGAETGSLAGLGPGTQMPAMASGVMSSSNNVASKTKDSTVKDINSVKGAINQTNESVNASKELGAVKCSDSSLKSDTVPQTKPVPYRPPGLRALVTSPSKTVFQSTVTNKTSNSVSEMSQNPFSAVKNLPVKPSANVTSTSSARPNPPNPNMNNSASGFGDLSKLVKPSANMTSTSSARPNPPNPNMNNSASGFGDFGKLVKPSADMTSASSARPNPPNPNMNNSASGFGDLNKLVKPSANVTSTSSARPNPPNPNANNSSSGFGDLSKPLRRPFKQYIPVSKSMDSITQPKDVVYDTIPNSSLASGADDFDEPLRPPSRTNISKPKSLPVSFSSVPEIKHVVSSHSLSMQGHKSANSNQSFIDSKPVVSQQSTEETSKHADFLPQYAKRHSPELREKVNEVQSRDFLPSFVKNISTEGNNLTENQQSFQGQLPPRFRRMSAPHHQSSTEDENWDDEIDPYAETKMMKINPKRELHMRSLSSRKPAPNEVMGPKDADGMANNVDPDQTPSRSSLIWVYIVCPDPSVRKLLDHYTLWQSSTTSQRKNSEADLTNPLMGRSTLSPGFDEGTSGLSDIPLPKKLRTSQEKTDKGGEKEEKGEEWCEVTTKKRKQKELKKYSAPYINSASLAPVKTQAEKQQIQSNFERLIEKILEKYPAAGRGEAIDSVTRLREQKGGTLKGMNLNDIVAQAGHLLEQQFRLGKTNYPPKIPGLWNSNSRLTPPKLNLPFVNSSLGHGEDEEICVICHDPLSSEETKALDCGHVFHSECISQWVYGRERTCPTCRQHALFPEEFPRLGK